MQSKAVLLWLTILLIWVILLVKLRSFPDTTTASQSLLVARLP